MIAKIRKASAIFFLAAVLLSKPAHLKAEDCSNFNYFCQTMVVTGGFLFGCMSAVNCAYVEECATLFGCTAFCFSESGSPWGGPDGSAGCP